MRALKTFFSWLHREDYTDTHRLAKPHDYKAEQKLKDIRTEEIAAILACFDVRTAAGARDVAILTLMIDGGPRRSRYARRGGSGAWFRRLCRATNHGGDRGFEWSGVMLSQYHRGRWQGIVAQAREMPDQRW